MFRKWQKKRFWQWDPLFLNSISRWQHQSRPNHTLKKISHANSLVYRFPWSIAPNDIPVKNKHVFLHCRKMEASKGNPEYESSKLVYRFPQSIQNRTILSYLFLYTVDRWQHQTELKQNIGLIMWKKAILVFPGK